MTFGGASASEASGVYAIVGLVSCREKGTSSVVAGQFPCSLACCISSMWFNIVTHECMCSTRFVNPSFYLYAIVGLVSCREKGTSSVVARQL